MKSYPPLLAGALSLVVSAIGAFAGDKPNIIFIMTDDQG